MKIYIYILYLYYIYIISICMYIYILVMCSKKNQLFSPFLQKPRQYNLYSIYSKYSCKYLSISLSVYLSIYLSIYLSTYIYILYIYIIYTYIYIYIHMYIFLSFSLIIFKYFFLLSENKENYYHNIIVDSVLLFLPTNQVNQTQLRNSLLITFVNKRRVLMKLEIWLYFTQGAFLCFIICLNPDLEGHVCNVITCF